MTTIGVLVGAALALIGIVLAVVGILFPKTRAREAPTGLWGVVAPVVQAIIRFFNTVLSTNDPSRALKALGLGLTLLGVVVIVVALWAGSGKSVPDPDPSSTPTASSSSSSVLPSPASS